MEQNDGEPQNKIVIFRMSKIIPLKATLSENVNLPFRIGTRLYHIIHKNRDIEKFPVIINNFNRLEWLKQQIDWLLSVGQKNIHVIDNGSTYPPLLKYYKKIPAKVYLLDRNKGHEALWRTHIFQRLGKYFYVYTDPDVLPTPDTPKDFMAYFLDVLNRYPQMEKVGFGLRTDDIPDHYPKKKEVLQWESGLLTNELEAGLYHSKIDTTFALYRSGVAFQNWETTIRCGEPYVLRHMPWYEDHNSLDEEAQYFLEHASQSSSWYKNVIGEDERYTIG